MISEKVIRQMILEEYEESNAEHEAAFVDVNHGFGVLHEEYREVMNEIEMIEMLHDTIDNLILAKDKHQLKETLRSLHQRSIYAVQELVQVAAMADKFVYSIEMNEGKENEE